jgi:cold shock protein
MTIGTVKWFNNQKGYGFICQSNGSDEIFAHFSSIVMEGYKSLKAGQKVEFEIQEGDKGLFAHNIRPKEQQNNDSEQSEQQFEAPSAIETGVG